MKCPKCQDELAQDVKFCSECGYDIRSGESVRARPHSSRFSSERDLAEGTEAGDALKPLSGFRRTLSTELVERQAELRTLIALNALIEGRTYRPGEVMIHQGETKRDLIFLIDGTVEISKKEGDGSLLLNEIEPPYILGDIAFLSGIPRTATARAKTEVNAFVLKYKDFRDLFKNSPEWLYPLLTSFVSRIKSVHDRAKELERRVQESTGEM